ncbi:MAG: gamma-glutamyltransferase [Planctomycetota bacterium]
MIQASLDEEGTMRSMWWCLMAIGIGLGWADDGWGQSRRLTRSAVHAPRGMVATSHPLAAQAGIDVLKAGGNAVDAAIATNAVLGVVEPMSCGIGGDLFVLLWDAKSQKLYGLNASGRAPRKATLDFFKEQNLAKIPTTGPLSWSVPGCVDGWEVLHRRFGKLSMTQILAPAVLYADEGFPLSPIIGRDWMGSADLLAETPDAARTFLKGGQSPRVGEMMTNRYLAETYRIIAREGAEPFYRGRIAEKIIAFSDANGGLFSLEDFAKHTSDWVEPVSTNYRGYDVWELPPNGQGIAVLQMLNLLEPHDLRKLGHNSADFLHLFIEAKKLAYADRARFYADPAFSDVPIAGLISKEYAARQAKRINPERAAEDVPAGDPTLVAGDTVYLTVVDENRNAVSFIQSNYFGWGSGLVPGDLGFVLQNRGTLFALDPEHPNRLEPGKRPFHTIIPAMVTHDGKPWLSFGVMGGDMQPQGHVQVLVNMIDHGMDPQQAGDAARARHFGSAEPTGQPMQGSGKVVVEADIPEEVVRELERRGHSVSRGSPGEFGGYQAIRLNGEQGGLVGGSDPRKDGAAIGY